jgi:hypothetical protein
MKHPTLLVFHTAQSRFGRVLASSVKLLLAAIVMLMIPGIGLSQTATTATIQGTVSDPKGAVIQGAEVELMNTATNQVFKQVTNESGQYTFSSVSPGVYKITVKMPGFRQVIIPSVRVEVAKSFDVPLKLEVGDVTEVVEVVAGAGVELQKTDATVGNTVGGEVILRLPSLARGAGEFLTLQPGVMPATGANTGGAVTGARSDQSTFSLDGIDISDNSIGGGANLATIIPTPVDSVEEFRVGVTNPNATFGRSAGAQVALVGRRGSNDYHGAAYWYHQNDNLNAANWTNKRSIGLTVTNPALRHKLQEPELKDNRFGGRIGGRLWRDKTFFFSNYEGRRFPRSFDILRIVPSDTLRQGILRFRDASGSIVSYDLLNSRLCGPAGDQPCDPRGVGISPTIRALFSGLPAGNDPASGDGLNTLGFRSSAPAPRDENFIVFRLDHNFTDKWQFNGSYTYFRAIQLGFANVVGQVSIRGGDTQTAVSVPNRADSIIGGLTGQLSPTLINTFRFGFVRTRNFSAATSPTASAALLNIPGTATSAGAVALELAGAPPGGGLLDEPIDVDTQRARSQGNDNRGFQFVEDLTWIKGNHTLQFGANIRHLPTLHIRDDKVVGSLASLVSSIDDGTFITIPDTARPRQCGGSVTTNCLTAADLTRWNRLYSATLGLLDNVGVLTARDGNLNPLPFGTRLVADTKLQSYEFYAQDSWRVSSSLTLTYGLAYQWQTPPKEKLGRQTFIINNENGQILNSDDYLAAKRQAALSSQAFNPQLAYLPIEASGRSNIHDIDWNNWGPRIAAAWNPSLGNGLFGRLFGDRKTVVRAGFGMVYDRLNTVQSVIIPMLGVGFAQTVSVNGPNCDRSGTPGRGCVPTGSDPVSAFRVGVDGSIPLPTVPQVGTPVVPPPGALSETLSFQVDPNFKVGVNYSADFTIQRELSGNMVIELGYAGRWGRNLNQSVNLNASPFFHVDPASRQSFAQAFDAVATALRNGQPPTPQPWFENQAPGGTNALVAANRGAFVDGLASDLFFNINIARLQAGMPTFNNFQVFDLFIRTDGGISNYHGFLVTLRKRMSRGLTFDLNYTFSKSLDQVGAVQNTAGYFPNPYNPDQEYGPSFFDRTHVFNATWLYELPTGKGHWLSTNNWFDNVLGGWYLSGIYRANTGIPLIAAQSTQVFGGGSIFGFASGAIPLTDPSSFGNSANSPVSGSNGIGTAGDPARGGSGINIFANPEQAFNSFRRILLSQDGRTGRANPLRGFNIWNVDMSLGKKTSLTESVNLVFSFDFFNVFNQVNFTDPAPSLQNRAAFGVVTTQFVDPNRTAGSRWIQFGMRVEF